ncbi:hypothetical protein [Clostridium sp. 1xD42-85]|uniref:hypothetical protein n=1 Tax=Clostridium sp. 1xD42-85 TaxID=2320084 RepID=UPI001A9B3A6A|nr:hypothetical protein [Clostridium sp. 1xD42-85]
MKKKIGLFVDSFHEIAILSMRKIRICYVKKFALLAANNNNNSCNSFGLEGER